MNYFQQVQQANQIFTPGAPVSQKDLFAGRTEQLARTVDTLSARGRHPVIFGQRGVGKTSLANILGDGLQSLITIKVSCDGSDTFSSIWSRVLTHATVSFKQQAFGFNHDEATHTITLAQAFGHTSEKAKPAEIAHLLSKLNSPCVIILDEFDKIRDDQTKTNFADLIKIMSDTVQHATLILVGVGNNIHELIGQHPSIDRNLVQIELPIMSDPEIRSIMKNGLDKLGINVDPAILNQVASLAGGYPHYGHLLGFCSAKMCFTNESACLDQELFDAACNMAIEDAIEKYRDAFSVATATTQQSRYPMILSACGYAQTDSRGIFRATDVVDAVRVVFNTDLSVQAVVPALGAFITEQRHNVLEPAYVGSKKCYRFREPMMRPFCRIKARELLRSAS